VCDQANVRSETKPIRQGCANMLLHQGYHTPQGAAIDEYKEMVWEGVEDQRNLITTCITYFYKNILHSAHITYLCVIHKTNSNYFPEQH